MEELSSDRQYRANAPSFLCQSVRPSPLTPIFRGQEPTWSNHTFTFVNTGPNIDPANGRIRPVVGGQYSAVADNVHSLVRVVPDRDGRWFLVGLRSQRG